MVAARSEDAVIACAEKGPSNLQEVPAGDRTVFERTEELKKAAKAAP